MNKAFIVLLTSLVTLSGVFASGYGGYDGEDYETTGIEIKIKGELRSTCKASGQSITDNVTIRYCEDKWTIDEKCDCLGDASEKVCEMTRTIGCTAEVNRY